jgi:hypothetical protein
MRYYGILTTFRRKVLYLCLQESSFSLFDEAAVPLKSRQVSNILHSVTFKKTVVLIFTAIRGLPRVELRIFTSMFFI